VTALVPTLSLLLTPAFTQERACDAVPLDALESRMKTVEGALSSMELGAARADIDHAAEEARCLAVPIPPALLERYAWARAELAAVEQDPELTWTWVRLVHEARGTGDETAIPAIPDRVAATHPLRRVLEEPRDPMPMSGPEGVALYTPKKGTLYADGRPLERPLLRASTPHLLQVFDRDGAPWLGSWQDGAVFPSAMLVATVTEGRRTRPTLDAGDAIPPKNWKPAKVGTELAYREWIRKHPDGPWVQAAKDAIDDLHWEAARTASETDGDLPLRQYLHEHPDGLHADDAEFLVEDMAYRTTLAEMAGHEDPEKAREAWVSFIEAWPKGRYALEARVQVEILDWDQARATNTSAAYATYLEQHPDGRNAPRAATLEEERAIDEALAGGLDKDLEAYLARWPDGTFAAEAKAVLGGVQFDAIALDVGGDVTRRTQVAVRDALLTALGEKKLPVVTASPGEPPPEGDLLTTTEPETPIQTASLAIDLWIEPGERVSKAGATLALEMDGLKRPLRSVQIDTTMLPDADGGALLGELLVANLGSFDRWHPPEPEEAATPRSTAPPAPPP
jgi:hypothetical protein